MTDKAVFTHFDENGNARMVNVSGKNDTVRLALAKGYVNMSKEAYSMVKTGSMKKGDVLSVARIAGIMAAKKVDQLIPLCHPLSIAAIDITFNCIDESCAIEIEAKVSVTDKTGVEMEALTAVAIAALTIYDMCKAVDKSMVIGDIFLLKKRGGKSGDYTIPL
jgi:cyclic pyranopterin phosphate synthase